MQDSVGVSAGDVSLAATGSGPALYRMHGIGSRKVGWAGIIPRLEGDFAGVSCDLRVHGESPVPPVPCSLDDRVQGLEAPGVSPGGPAPYG